jgi:hypothetical protein
MAAQPYTAWHSTKIMTDLGQGLVSCTDCAAVCDGVPCHVQVCCDAPGLLGSTLKWWCYAAGELFPHRGGIDHDSCIDQCENMYDGIS